MAMSLHGKKQTVSLQAVQVKYIHMYIILRITLVCADVITLLSTTIIRKLFERVIPKSAISSLTAWTAHLLMQSLGRLGLQLNQASYVFAVF